MKAWKKSICGIFLALAAFLLPVTAEAAPVYENYVQYGDDLTYGNVISYGSQGRVEGFSLQVDPGKQVNVIVSACDTIYGGMTADSLVDYLEAEYGYDVIAAVNADFFNTSNHIPLGLVIENGIYKSSGENRNAVCLDKRGNGTLVSQAEISLWLEGESGDVLQVTHLNKARQEQGGLYLFSEYFSTVSTRTSTPGWYVAFEIKKGELTPNASMKLEVVDKTYSSEPYPLKEGMLVLSAADASGLKGAYQMFEIGDTVKLTAVCSDKALQDATWAVGGGDILAEDGVMTNSSSWDSSIRSGNHPRSALGIRSDGSLYFFVADGRRSGYSNGMTLAALAEFMLEMGCEDVINLDGGGSSTLCLQTPGNLDPATMNRPSDGSQRRCATYFLLVAGQKSNGRAENLYLQEEGTFLLRGASLPLNILATDRAYQPADVPDLVEMTVTGGKGSLSGSTYTAAQAGYETIRLKGSGADGQGHLYVTDTVDDITVTDLDTGKTVDKLVTERGSSVRLGASATYLGRNVETGDAVTWNVLGEIGSINEKGVFTAGSKTGVTGEIVVSCGKYSRSIGVSVPAELEDIAGHWAEPYIRDLFKSGVVTGVTATAYEPGSSIRRGDFVLMLYRAAGSPAVSGVSSFNDVYATDYYSAAITWAQQKGIAKGGETGGFAPKDTLSREQAFALIYRAYPELGGTVDAETVLSRYSDGNAVSSYARESVAALISGGVIQGSGNALNPQGSLTRGEMAKILYMALN